jgi:hypothetical protein
MQNNITLPVVDLESQLAASQAELAAARATIASLQRQLRLRVEAISFTVVCVAPRGDFDEPTRRRGPAVIRREPIAKVIDVPYVEVRP